MPSLIFRTVDQWVAQVQEAQAAIVAKNGGVDPPTVRACYDVDPAAFTRLTEAMVALEPHTGLRIGQDLVDLAGLRPVDEII